MAIGITCDSPPIAVIGTAYSHFFPVTGDTPPDVFTISVGALPAGLTINAVTGEVSGIPLGPAGTSNFTVHVVDSLLATADAACSIEVNAALAITAAPPSGLQGSAYSYPVPATGGVTPYTFSISVGTLPPGLTIDPATGVISGTPTQAGVFPFTVHVEDSYAGGPAPDTADIETSITIGTNLSISCDNPPAGFVGVAYSHTIPASGGTEPYTFAITGGALPPGLSLNAGTGIISGTPTTKGVYTFTVSVADEEDATVSVECSITIRGKCLVD